MGEPNNSRDRHRVRVFVVEGGVVLSQFESSGLRVWREGMHFVGSVSENHSLWNPTLESIFLCVLFFLRRQPRAEVMWTEITCNGSIHGIFVGAFELYRGGCLEPLRLVWPLPPFRGSKAPKSTSDYRLERVMNELLAAISRHCCGVFPPQNAGARSSTSVEDGVAATTSATTAVDESCAACSSVRAGISAALMYTSRAFILCNSPRPPSAIR